MVNLRFGKFVIFSCLFVCLFLCCFVCFFSFRSRLEKIYLVHSKPKRPANLLIKIISRSGDWLVLNGYFTDSWYLKKSSCNKSCSKSFLKLQNKHCPIFQKEFPQSKIVQLHSFYKNQENWLRMSVLVFNGEPA